MDIPEYTPKVETDFEVFSNLYKILVEENKRLKKIY